LGAEAGREEPFEIRHRGVHFGICKCPGSILHNYPKRKAFSAFGQIFPAVKVEQPHLPDQARPRGGEGA
jgi:hypothetical protein